MQLADGSVIRDPDRAFQALDLVVRRRLDGLLQGDNAGLRLGAGSDPEEVVRYRPGEDDVRRIDWNVTARSSEPHVWRPLAQHELDTWVLVDETASMDFGTVSAEKRDVAAWVTAAIGLLTDGPGNRIGVARHTAYGIRWETPLPGRIAARRALRRTDANRAQSGEAVDLAHAMSALERRQRRPGLRVIVSDFVEPDGTIDRPLPWEPALRRLAARHDVVVVDVSDPRDLELPDLGHLVLTDPESGRQREVYTSPDLRRRYAAAAAAHRGAVAEAVRATGAGHVALRTDSDWVRDLARFVRTRRRAPRVANRSLR
ncbi:uncharacterized protein DUF58 [Knoellia remsis]|uniref:Uncharacterized protein DUF58 n=1 Tax=Knoellia remsis TaxID=407159 RepID=A0A2T0U862_9MICO|nr:DUF58 domain-containing protein [Knoellia remsis]PRY54104.1 uncharacterized protein DUF58 [Knoellia remsis]